MTDYNLRPLQQGTYIWYYASMAALNGNRNALLIFYKHNEVTIVHTQLTSMSAHLV